MVCSVITIEQNGRTFFDDIGSVEICSYCKEKRSLRDSKCNAHYQKLFDSAVKSVPHFFSCPYGLTTTGPVIWNDKKRIFYGFLLKNKSDGTLPEKLAIIAQVTEEAISTYIKFINTLVNETKESELQVLEAAIHDARHLNKSITLNAEILLERYGYSQHEEWDMQSIQKDETHKRTLTIYCASRDLSQAISLHEIARDPTVASREYEQLSLHKLFYRQLKIGSDKFLSKGLKVNLQSYTGVRRLTKSFELIPKILIDNASKYAAKGSDINISFIESGALFRIECTNKGPLIKPHEADLVFTRNYRGANRSGIEGHGLGLWLARIIVEANGGSIEFETNETGKDISGRRIGISRVVITLVGRR